MWHRVPPAKANKIAVYAVALTALSLAFLYLSPLWLVKKPVSGIICCSRTEFSSFDDIQVLEHRFQFFLVSADRQYILAVAEADLREHYLYRDRVSGYWQPVSILHLSGENSTRWEVVGMKQFLDAQGNRPLLPSSDYIPEEPIPEPELEVKELVIPKLNLAWTERFLLYKQPPVAW
jgi:hypothetical protein